MKDDQEAADARDPHTCRAALRDIGEIAATAVLPDSRMTDQEALRTIGAIAKWVREGPPGGPPDCGSVIQRVHGLAGSVDVEALDDPEALRLFSEVLGVLEASDSDVFPEAHGVEV